MDNSSLEGSLVRQRKFYLYMSPFEGHELASEHGNFDMPSKDVLESEIRDTLAAWLTVQQSSIGSLVADSAWWMLRIMDPENRKGADESMKILDGLTSFAMSILCNSLDQNLITLTEDVELPDIVISTDQHLTDDDFSFLRNLDLSWEDFDGDS